MPVILQARALWDMIDMIETGEGEYAADGGDPKLEKTVMS
jgi:hypothetical protein